MGETPTREVLWNITNHWIMYPLFILAGAPAGDAPFSLLSFEVGMPESLTDWVMAYFPSSSSSTTS